MGLYEQEHSQKVKGSNVPLYSATVGPHLDSAPGYIYTHTPPHTPHQ